MDVSVKQKTTQPYCYSREVKFQRSSAEGCSGELKIARSKCFDQLFFLGKLLLYTTTASLLVPPPEFKDKPSLHCGGGLMNSPWSLEREEVASIFQRFCPVLSNQCKVKETVGVIQRRCLSWSEAQKKILP